MCAVEGKLSTNTLLAMPYRLIADRANRAGRDFLQIDSEIGLTFSGIALAANDNEKEDAPLGPLEKHTTRLNG